jgi:hypothetical protein
VARTLEARFERTGINPATARAIAAILLVAQFLAVAHYHPRQSAQCYSASAALSPNDGLCALCLFHHYSPTVSAALFPIPPVMIGHPDLFSAQCWPLYSFNSYLSGRSPPASA